MESNITIHLSKTACGEISIQTPVDLLDTVLAKLGVSSLNSAGVSATPIAENAPSSADSPASSDIAAKNAEPVAHADKNATKHRKPASSKHAETFHMVDLGLDEQSRLSLRAFYNEKNPSSQNEQILVVMAWLKANAERDCLSKDAIFTALRTVDAKIPARITSVISNLRIAGKITIGHDGYKILHTGEDFVKFDLPKKDV